MRLLKNKTVLAILVFVLVVAGFGWGSYAVTPLPEINRFTEFGSIHRFEVDSEFSENEDFVYNYLRTAGYSTAAVCGIMGNIRTENTGFEADLYGYGGATYGLFQWTDSGNRKQDLVHWCNQHVIFANHIDGQLEYMMDELAGGDDIACRLEDFLDAERDPVRVAEEFAAGFERCVGSTGNSTDGIYQGTLYPEYKGQTFQGLEARKENAQMYYDVYSQLDEKAEVE